jgi:hypothetical protein
VQQGRDFGPDFVVAALVLGGHAGLELHGEGYFFHCKTY